MRFQFAIAAVMLSATSVDAVKLDAGMGAKVDIGNPMCGYMNDIFSCSNFYTCEWAWVTPQTIPAGGVPEGFCRSIVYTHETCSKKSKGDLRDEANCGLHGSNC